MISVIPMVVTFVARVTTVIRQVQSSYLAHLGSLCHMRWLHLYESVFLALMENSVMRVAWSVLTQNRWTATKGTTVSKRQLVQNSTSVATIEYVLRARYTRYNAHLKNIQRLQNQPSVLYVHPESVAKMELFKAVLQVPGALITRLTYAQQEVMVKGTI